MTESDPTRDYLIYAVEVLRQYFQSRQQVYVSGNLFIYYREGDPKAVASPDVFIFSVRSHGGLSQPPTQGLPLAARGV